MLGVLGVRRVPEEILTPTDFEVLQGLMEYDPEKRLTRQRL
jgi:hypothetical protein